MKKLVLTNLFLGVPTENRTQISRFKALRDNPLHYGNLALRAGFEPATPRGAATIHFPHFRR